MRKILIDKYLNGETSPDEENALRQMLLDIPDGELSPAERALRLMLTKVGGAEDIFAVDCSAEYDAKIQAEQAHAQVADADTEDRAKDIELKPKIHWRRFVGIAASVIIVFSFAFTLLQFENNQQMAIASEDEDQVLTDEEINAYLAEVAGAGYYADMHSMNAANIIDDIQERKAFLHSQFK